MYYNMLLYNFINEGENMSEKEIIVNNFWKEFLLQTKKILTNTLPPQSELQNPNLMTKIIQRFICQELHF